MSLDDALFPGTWITGAAGLAVSMVKVFAFESADTFPPASVARTSTVCDPTDSWVDTIENVPPVAVPVPTSVAPSYTLTVEPASA